MFHVRSLAHANNHSRLLRSVHRGWGGEVPLRYGRSAGCLGLPVTLLQVHNLVILVGTGASFHLGSPRTRQLKNKEVTDLIVESGASVEASDSALLSTLNPADSGDLEKLLNGHQLAVALSAEE